MPANTIPIFTKAARWASQRYTNADGKNLKTLFTAGPEGSRIENLVLSSSDTVAHDVFIWAVVGGVEVRLFHIDLPAHAGNNGSTVAQPGFNSATGAFLTQDVNGNRYIDLPPNTELRARMGASITNANQAAPNLNYAGTEAIGVTIVIQALDY